MDQDAAPDDGAADSPGGNPPDGNPVPTGTCSSAAAGLTCSAPYCVPEYELTDVGTLAVNVVSTASAIDEAGNVAGFFSPSPQDGVVHAFHWSARDGFVDLGTLGGDSSRGFGVSGARVVGESDLASGGSHAILGDEGGLHDLGTLGGAGSVARSINAAGVAVGESSLASGVQRATRYEDGMPSDLGTLAGTPTSTSEALAINDSGVIVGRSDTAGRESHAALWANGTVVDLGTIGTRPSIATAISANGTVAGAALGALNVPLRFTGGTVVAPIPGRAFTSYTPTGINDAGVIVGNTRIVTAEGSGAGPGFVFDGTSATELTDLLPWPLPDRGRITQANAINNAGQIAAAGSFAGHTGALVLTPHCIPAPPFRSLAVAFGTSVAAPDGITAGDLLLAAVKYDGHPATVTPPDGWSLVIDQPAGAPDTTLHALVYMRIATASEPASYTFDAPGGVPVRVHLAAYPTLSTIDEVSATTAIAGSIAAQPVTTTRNNAVLIGIFMGSSGSAWTRASGDLGRMAQRSNTGGISLQDEWRPAAGPSGDRFSATVVAAPLVAILIALR